ncbi:hypothetical protein PAHAL_7G052300 [Panicum hallii]|uniref:Uncharacterized protein n=1 Tax=Panicum hallii TaxID=206008 RepID=A0A270R6Y0_9POAL|nr:hypothetical protein PAHAL_7G052300 [Panicum hallii]
MTTCMHSDGEVLFLEEFVTLLGLGPPTFTGRQGNDGMAIVGAKVILCPAHDVPFIYHEAARNTLAEAEQAALLMVIHALAAEHHVEIRDVNFPQVQCLRYQVAEKLCVELMSVIRSSENEVMFLEPLTQRFC